MKNLFTKTLLLGGLAGSLALGGCKDLGKEVKGEIISEKIEEKTIGTCRAYVIKDKENKEHIAIIENISFDPFDKGDYVGVKLRNLGTYIRGGRCGYEIIGCKRLKNK